MIDPKTFQIRIESINGGMSIYDFAAAEDQFYDSLGIEPDNANYSNTGRGTGPTIIGPNKPRSITSTALTGVPLWMKGEPKSGSIFVYDANGSVYTLGGSSVTGLGDLNDGGSSHGNGMAYYDNYIYFSRDTTVARYGPLNGTAAFTDDYWITTLGKTALEMQAYPDRDNSYTDAFYPNHVMHRHRGKLYFADTIGGQGYIHIISTTKTTVEGDTDSGSTYGAFALPYGYFVTDIESLGDDLVISAFESKSILNTTLYNSALSYEGRSALFFWDTVASRAYRIIQDEFPDQIISALENANGVLYTFSANIGTQPTGVRVCRYLGGNNFEQIALLADADVPFAGGTLSRLNQILFTSVNQYDSSRACVWAIGTQNQPLSNALFNVAGARKSTGAGHAICQKDGGAPWSTEIFYSYANNNTSGTIEGFGGNESDWDTDLVPSTQGNAYWKSKWGMIGSRYKVKRVKIQLPDPVQSTIDVRIYLDRDFLDNPTLIGTINQTNYPSKQGHISLRPESFIGNNSLQIIIRWFGTRAIPIALPIIIEWEPLDDD